MAGPAVVGAALDALDAAADEVIGLGAGGLGDGDRVQVLARLSALSRRLGAYGYDTVNLLVEEASSTDIGGPLRWVLADRLSISPAAAVRMIAEAAEVGTRRAISGQVLAPRMPTVAAQAHAGRIGAEHVGVIREFFRRLPSHVGFEQRVAAEAMLGGFAADLRPDQLRKAAAALADRLNPDGQYSDADRAAQRGFCWKTQRPDGISVGMLWATPQLRATLDAVIATWGAPGMCNPDDPPATLDGDPPAQAVRTDTRRPAQRAHDALAAMGRAVLASGKLGTHRGLPATIIVSTTLQELSTAAGVGVTATGTTVPMRDVIRLASSAYHYLAVFDEHTQRALYLGRTRIASADQRIVLYARDRGCTFPGCDQPACHTEVHHLTPYRNGGKTHPQGLGLTCHTHHLLADQGWTTRLNNRGHVEWIPPPHLPRDRPTTNNFHHPERYLEPEQHDE